MIVIITVEVKEGLLNTDILSVIVYKVSYQE